jgi:hypothetical protein
MRIAIVLVPLSLFAAPALAQSAPPMPVVAPPQMQVPPEIADPAAIDRMTNVLEVLSKSLLDVPIGEVRAAAEGRPPSVADRHETLGRATGLNEGKLRAKIEAARPMVQHGAEAMARALPRILQSVAEVRGSVDRAIANLPDPNYPRR